MALTDNKITTYADNIVDLSDTPNADGLSADQLKAFFDSRGDNEIKDSINGICDDLTATTDGSSGADQVGATALSGGTATTVQGLIEEVDSASVHKTGDETIAGVKTFSSSPVVPPPTADMQVPTKKYVDDTVSDSPSITFPVINGGDALTATSTELNVLDGITSSTSELNILDGVLADASEINILNGATLSTSELNVLDGITSSTAELNILDGVTSSTTELNILDGATLSTTELNILDGATLSTTELNYVDGVTSSIQTQFTGKVGTTAYNRAPGFSNAGGSPNAITIALYPAATSYTHGMRVAFMAVATNTAPITINVNSLGARPGVIIDASGTHSIPAGDIVPGGVYEFIYSTVAECFVLNGALPYSNSHLITDAGGYFTGTTSEEALQEIGALTSGITASATEINILDGATLSTSELNVLDGITASTAELNVLDGIPATLTATEIGYLDGVTSSVQTQLNSVNSIVRTIHATEDTVPTDYLAHLFTVTGYAQSQPMPNNADGKALWKVEGLTATNLVSGESVANGGSVSFSSVSGNKYYDTLNNVVLTGTGSTMTSTNSSGATASMMIIDLNGCGLQTKTNTELAVIFPYYFDDTKSTLAGMRLFGRGKNRIDNSKLLVGGYYGSDGSVVSEPTSVYSKEYIRVEQGNYKCNRTIGIVHVVEYGKSKNLIQRLNISSATSYVYTNTNPLVEFIRVSFYQAGAAAIGTIQLELGSTATPYEPYCSATSYAPMSTLRSVPSAKDSVEMGTDGKVWKTQRVSDDYELVAGDITSLVVSRTNFDMITITKPSNMSIYGNSTESLANAQTIFISGYRPIATGSADNAGNAGGYSNYSGTSFIIDVAKGTYANLAAAQAALAGTIIRYELATPITTELETIGELTAYPNGSILAEPCYSGYATSASTVIGTASLPIKAINKVESVSLDANGNAVRSDVTASCSVDTTTLTITGYDATKVYFYDLDIDTKYTTNGLKTYQVECPTAVVTHDFAAGSTAWTLTANENKATYFTPTNAGGAANIIAEPKDGKLTVWKNASGQTLTVKTASSTGVTITNGKTATLVYTGTDFIKIAEV